MPNREVAIIRMADDRPASRHFVGMPEELAPSGQGRGTLAWPRIALIIERPDGVFLERFTDQGALVGDTWHMTVENAKEQAAKEYGGLLGSWHRVPIEVEDDAIPEYVRKHLE